MDEFQFGVVRVFVDLPLQIRTVASSLSEHMKEDTSLTIFYLCDFYNNNKMHNMWSQEMACEKLCHVRKMMCQKFV